MFASVGNRAASPDPSGRGLWTRTFRGKTLAGAKLPRQGKDTSCLNTDLISRRSDRFDWNRLHVLPARVGLGPVGGHPAPQKARFSCTALEPDQ